MGFVPQGRLRHEAASLNNTMTASMLHRWLTEEDGQDILEYALLASFLGFSAVAGVNFLGSAMNTAYTAWDSAAQSDAVVEMPDPQ
jgi:Flp pilus assembly pilin Flp